MAISKTEFKKYIFNDYISSRFEDMCFDPAPYQSGSNYARIHWERFYMTLRHFESFKKSDSNKILDVGAFPGTLEVLLRNFLKLDCELFTTGLNFSDDYLSFMEALRVKCAAVDLDPPYYNINKPPYGFEFPWETGSFDFVFALEVIEHLLNPLKMLEEIKRVLKPGGRLLLSTDNQNDIGNILNLLVGNSINQPIKQGHIYNNLSNREHVHAYNHKELRELFEILDFRQISIYSYNIQHNCRKYNLKKQVSRKIRNILYVFPLYRPRLFLLCEK